MTELFIDIETFSSVDLKKSNVYRYSEDDDFLILMAAWAVDDGPVSIALTTEEIAAIPHLWDDDDTIIRIAHNAPFERICFSSFSGGEYLPPEDWDDTMILAAEHGYPKKLEHLAVALGAELKDAAGTRLINLFCKPNRQGKRNMPEDFPEEWEAFKRYCMQDVETLRDVRRKLPGWPTEAEREAWLADQRINDAGIPVDTVMAAHAVEAAAENAAVSTAAIKRLTGIENPNSGPQMLAWLQGEGVPVMNLQAATVKELLEDDLAPKVRSVLEMRQDIALVAAKKYSAALDRVSADGRLRGSFQFFGAHTGRWCLTGDHEVLTDKGWARLDEWQGGSIACWSPDSVVAFSPSRKVSFPYEGEMIRHDSTTVQQVATPDHRMPYYSGRGVFKTGLMSELADVRHQVPVTGTRSTYSTPAGDQALRVLVMTQADGHFTEDHILRFGFKKKRKIDRCVSLLSEAGVGFSLKESSVNGVTFISIPRREQPRWLSDFSHKTFGPWVWQNSPEAFFTELVNWDGCWSGPNTIEYVTCNKENADIVQAFAHMSGRTARVTTRNRPEKNWSTAYRVSICSVPNPSPRQQPKHLSREDFSGAVYCAETETGYFLVRRNGKVWITGNSGRGVQLQNLPRAALSSETATTAAILDLKLGLGASPFELKALVRAMFVGPFTVVDYSAIEARVIAWLAGEQWALDAFYDGRDIYTETATRMQVKTRQEGKVACIAEGSKVLTHWGMVEIEKVTTDHLVWDGLEWVAHDGLIYRGEKRVIEYDGLTATEDHLVWVEGESGPIRFDIAASSGSRLLRSGDGGFPLWVGNYYQSRETLHPRVVGSLRADPVPGVSSRAVDELVEPFKREDRRMPTVQPAAQPPREDPEDAPRSAVSVHKAFRSVLSPLRRARDSVQLRLTGLRGSLGSGESWGRRGGYVPRPGQQRRTLRAGESAVGLNVSAVSESTSDQAVLLRPGFLALRGTNGAPEAAGRPDSGADHRRRAAGRRGATERVAHDRGTVAVYDLLNAGPHHRFTVSDVLVHNCLALGYAGGVGSLRVMGAQGSDERLQFLVNQWRDANPAIVTFWRELEEAFRHGGAAGEHISVEKDGRDRMMQLPSGRAIVYHDLRGRWVQKWGKTVQEITFADPKMPGLRTGTYSGKLAENATQAVARDILTEAMVRLHDDGYEVVGHVHDECIVKGTHPVEDVSRVMVQSPAWGAGLPIAAAGFQTMRYRKD